MQVKIKYHIEHPEEIGYPITLHENGDWIDLRCAEDLVIKKGEIKYINLGVSMQLPMGYEAYVAPRSSTLMTYGLIGIFGIIDNKYCGDNDIWHFLTYATRDIEIPKGHRICQFRLMQKMPRDLQLNRYNELGNPNRGGLGSTGFI